MDKKNTGLYNKFIVTRTDGKSAEGEKHHGCEYFVLDVTHDQFAVPALRAYAEACRAEYPLLAKDLDDKLPPQSGDDAKAEALVALGWLCNQVNHDDEADEDFTDLVSEKHEKIKAAITNASSQITNTEALQCLGDLEQCTTAGKLYPAAFSTIRAALSTPVKLETIGQVSGEVVELKQRIQAAKERLRDAKAIHSNWYTMPKYEAEAYAQSQMSNIEMIIYSAIMYLDGEDGPNRAAQVKGER